MGKGAIIVDQKENVKGSENSSPFFSKSTSEARNRVPLSAQQPLQPHDVKLYDQIEQVAATATIQAGARSLLNPE